MLKKYFKIFLMMFIILVLVAISYNYRYIVYDYTQKANLFIISKLDRNNRIFPHGVNSIKQLKDTLSYKFNNLEVDLYYFNNAFYIGHENAISKENKLDAYLKSIPRKRDIKNIWMDLKNLNSDNIDFIIESLSNLEPLLRNSSIIVESKLTDNELSKLRTSNYHSSYYMPDNLPGIKGDKEATLLSIAKTISQQIKNQNVAAISFHESLYPFVKKYMEPRISPEIVYHTWVDVNLALPSALPILLTKSLYYDNRIKSIIVETYTDTGFFLN